MWENSSSRACSKGVGVETFLGSERFFAMREGLLSFGRGAGSERRRNVTADPARRKGGTRSLASRRGGAGSSFRVVTAGRRRGFPRRRGNIGRREHERRQGSSVRAGARRAAGGVVARAGGAYPGARPRWSAARGRARSAAAAGQRAERAVSLRGAVHLRHPGGRREPA